MYQVRNPQVLNPMDNSFSFIIKFLSIFMNIIINIIIRPSSLKALLAGMLILASIQASPAQEVAKDKLATTVWVNSFYGRDNSGIGLGIRRSVLGFGATVFNFAGGTSSTSPSRQGAICISADFYLAADFNNWIALYGNVGYAGRMITYNKQRKPLLNFPKRDFLSTGAGLQITLASHLMLGAGCNFVIDLPDETGGRADDPIQSIVAQLGYRL